MKLYEANIECKTNNLKATFLLVSQSKEKALEDANGLFETVMDSEIGYSLPISIIKIRITEISTIDTQKIYYYIIPIAGGCYYEGHDTIKDILEKLVHNDDCYYAKRKVILKSMDGEQKIIYYSGSCNKSALEAIERCQGRGIDPYGY